MYRYIFDTQAIHTDNQDIIKIAIHERYTNNYRKIDDIPSKKRHPGMKQTTVYHHFSTNMITKKHYFTENITTLQQHCNKRATICDKMPFFEIKN